MSSYPANSRKIDRALADLRDHLTWLTEHRSAEGTTDWRIDVAREIGVAEAMDALRRHGAKEQP